MGRTLRNILVAGGGIVVATILATAGTVAYDFNIRQPAKERRILTSEYQISIEVIKQYEAQGVIPGQIKELHRKKVTPEIVSQLKEKEGLNPHDIFRLVVFGDVPDKYIVFQQRNFDGAEYQRWISKGLNLELMTESTNRNLTLEDALAGIAAGFPAKKSGANAGGNAGGFLRLADHHIGIPDATRLKEKDYTIDQMVQQYAEAVGVSPDDRKDYLRMDFTDPNIKIFSAKKLTPKIVGILSGRREYYRGFRTTDEPPIDREDIIKLVNTGKLSGEIYDKWNAAGFRDEEFVAALRDGYNLYQAKRWRDAGFSVNAMIEFGAAGIKLDEATKHAQSANILRHYPPRF